VGLTTHSSSSAEVKERVQLYIYSLSGPSWPVIGWTLYVRIRFNPGFSRLIKRFSSKH